MKSRLKGSTGASPLGRGFGFGQSFFRYPSWHFSLMRSRLMRASSARVPSSSSGARSAGVSQFAREIVRDGGIARPQPNERIQQFGHLFARKLGEPPAATWVCESLDSVFAQLE